MRELPVFVVFVPRFIAIVPVLIARIFFRLTSAERRPGREFLD